MQLSCSAMLRWIPVFSLLTALLLPLWNTAANAESLEKAAPGSKEAKVITFAYFPMAVPVVVLGETLKRDMILQKALKQEGVTIAFKTFAKGNDVLRLIIKDQIDAVMFADFPSIEAVITGDMLIVGMVKRSFSSVVAPLGTRVEQLRKMRVGNAHGSTSHYALLQALGSVGLSEKVITLVPLEVNQMADALASGTIDAFAAWEPTPTAAVKKYPGRFTSIYRHISNSYLLVSGSLADEHPVSVMTMVSSILTPISSFAKTASGSFAKTIPGFNTDGPPPTS